MNHATAALGAPPPAFEPAAPTYRVYVWELPVRVAHWAIALSLVWCAATGYYLGSPFIIASGPATGRFVMGTVKVLHFYGAIVFVLAVAARVLWMFVGRGHGRWTDFVPVARARRKGLLSTVKFYLFLAPTPPGFVGHNPLAGLTYCLVFLLYFTIIATGLALYASSAHVDSPMRAFTALVPLVGGLQTARWVHHVVMWLLLGFAAHHVYSAWLVSKVEGNGTLESIFTGYKFIRSRDAHDA